MASAETIDETIEDGTLLTTENVTATTRDVYGLDGTVIKVPKRDFYQEVNRKEVRNWRRANNQDMTLPIENVLAPIVDHAEDWSWVEMVECKPIYTDEAVDAFKEKVAADCPFTIGDLHIDNIGRHPETGQLVCFDYAEMDFPNN